jgi:hypothetical protein
MTHRYVERIPAWTVEYSTKINTQMSAVKKKQGPMTKEYSTKGKIPNPPFHFTQFVFSFSHPYP